MKTKNKDLQIFVLSFGRAEVPTLKLLACPSDAIVLTSVDNKFKDQIKTNGAQLLVFNKDDFRGRGLEMMNDASVPHRRSAVYAYNYAIEWGRTNGVRYVCVLDDDYTRARTVNDRNKLLDGKEKAPRLDVWARHECSFLKAHPYVAATCAVNDGQLFANLRSAFFSNLDKRQLMNTIIFDVTKDHNFISLGNGDYVTQAITNSASTDLIVRLQTLSIEMEKIKDKRHQTIDYSDLFYSRWALKMVAPAYSDVRILNAGRKSIMSSRFNSIWLNNSAPKIISL